MTRYHDGASCSSCDGYFWLHDFVLHSCGGYFSLVQVDFMFNSSKHAGSLRKLLTSYSSSVNRQTIFASASIPQHRRFLYDCVQQKWTKVFDFIVVSTLCHRDTLLFTYIHYYVVGYVTIYCC